MISLVVNLLPAGVVRSFVVWTLPFDQSGKVEPTRDRGPRERVIEPNKPHHRNKVMTHVEA